jgi:hypothetical protein
MSWTGLCGDCARALLTENIEGLHYKRGAPWKRWRRAMAACVGAVLPDDG